jgi:hypothetical protein
MVRGFQSLVTWRAKNKNQKQWVGWKGLEKLYFCTLSLLPPQTISKPHNPINFCFLVHLIFRVTSFLLFRFLFLFLLWLLLSPQRHVNHHHFHLIFLFLERVGSTPTVFFLNITIVVWLHNPRFPFFF